MKSFLCIALALSPLFMPECVALDGAWRGNLEMKPAGMPLVFNFSTNAKGKLTCTLDSPMQGVKGIKTIVSYCDDDSVAINISSIGARYRAKITPEGMSGTFTQRGFSFKLDLQPELSIYDRRPQTPRPPFPYTTVDTTFIAADGVELAATVTFPEKPLKGYPAVVMVTGSGPQNRDEELFEHRPFAVIADFLARNGVASLRYDDRGTAKSGGHFASADILTFKSDALQALNFMKKINRGGKVGILGHSEGATIALMIGAEKAPAFIVSMAAATIAGKELILAQNLRLLKQVQLSDRQISDAISAISFVFDEYIAGKDITDIDVDRYIGDNNLDVDSTVLASMKRNMTATAGDYFRQLLSLNPSKWVGKIKCPVLAINGDRDTQVGSEANLGVIREKLSKAKVKEYPGLNHLFQHAETGEMTEYVNISETISQEVLEDIVTFISTLK